MKVSSLLFSLGRKSTRLVKPGHIFDYKLQDLEFESIHFVNI